MKPKTKVDRGVHSSEKYRQQCKIWEEDYGFTKEVRHKIRKYTWISLTALAFIIYLLFIIYVVR